MNNIIYEVSKKKTNILGLWKDNTGKIYRDYIKFYHPKNANEFNSKIELMFLQDEKAIFVKGKDKAFCISQYNLISFSQNIQYKREKLSFNEIKNLLNEYNGLTIIKENNSFLIDIWQE